MELSAGLLTYHFMTSKLLLLKKADTQRVLRVVE